MTLTADNYFSTEAQMAYMSVSQLKSFLSCEARALAECRGEYRRKATASLLVGSYVDAWFEGSLAQFQKNHPEVFTHSGELRAEYRQAEKIIARLSRDKFFMKYMAGQKQVIRTGRLFGVDWKIKMDSYHPGRAIVDLKVVKDFAPIYKEGEGRLGFVEAWGYDLQGAVYQAVEGGKLPFFLAAATKEPVTDFEVFRLGQPMLDAAMAVAGATVERFAGLKEGLGEPVRCERCDYCKQTKVLDHVTDWEGVE